MKSSSRVVSFAVLTVRCLLHALILHRVSYDSNACFVHKESICSKSEEA
jgi:hypothetical protein